MTSTRSLLILHAGHFLSGEAGTTVTGHRPRSPRGCGARGHHIFFGLKSKPISIIIWAHMSHFYVWHLCDGIFRSFVDTRSDRRLGHCALLDLAQWALVRITQSRCTIRMGWKIKKQVVQWSRLFMNFCSDCQTPKAHSASARFHLRISPKQATGVLWRQHDG